MTRASAVMHRTLHGKHGNITESCQHVSIEAAIADRVFAFQLEYLNVRILTHHTLSTRKKAISKFIEFRAESRVRGKHFINALLCGYERDEECVKRMLAAVHKKLCL